MPLVFTFSICISLAVAGSGAESAGIWIAWILPTSVWCLMEGKRVTISLVVAVSLIAVVAVASTTTAFTFETAGGDIPSGEWADLKRFSSYAELENFVMTNQVYYAGYGYYDLPFGRAILATPSSTAWSLKADSSESDFQFTIGDDGFSITAGDSTDFSATNIQVEGVDEADIVKCDGEYLYVVSGNTVFIIDAYPPEDAKVLSDIQESENPREIYINEDKLVVLGPNFAKVYDISDKENPVFKREVSFDGYYFNSRMIGDYVYLIINSPLYYDWVGQVDFPGWMGRIDLPEISCNGKVRTIQANEIYYFENVHDYSYQFVTIMAMNTQNDDEKITSKTFLMSTAQNLFVSSNNIYITHTNYGIHSLSKRPNGRSYWKMEKTTIHKISIVDGEIVYKSQGDVPGRVLNQFSMDEYHGYFRIATTTGQVWGTGANEARNHVYILDEDLNIVGRLENLAPGERIYSARFLGSRAYLVTFRQVDPLFVLDLSNPQDPKVLGELKIPGYSDYLHPYDETHIIGVGRERGVKIALFDVSDPENPQEISKYETGEWSTHSYALDDHKAFLFSKSKNLLVIPIGRYWNQDAYVFDISVDDGIVLKGTITHGGYPVKRSLYIDNVLYTVSEGLIKMNDLADLSEINSVELPISAQQPPVDFWSITELNIRGA